MLGRICEVLDVDFGDIVEYVHESHESEADAEMETTEYL